MKKKRIYLADRFFASLLAILFCMVMGLKFSFFYLVAISLSVLLLGFLFLDFVLLRSNEISELRFQLPSHVSLGEEFSFEFEVFWKQRNFSELYYQSLDSRFIGFPETSYLISSRNLATSFFKEKVKALSLGGCSIQFLELLFLSRFKLLLKEESVKAQNPWYLRIHPSLHSMTVPEFQDLISKQKLFFQGSKQMVRGRSPDQFYTIREYRYPDPLKYIDARKSAKHKQLMTRVYDTFYDHHLILVLDLGVSMKGHFQTSSKLDFYLSAADKLAELAYLKRDRVSLITIDDQVKPYFIASRKMNDKEILLNRSETFVIKNTPSSYDQLSNYLEKVSGGRSLVFILSDATRPSVQDSMLQSLKNVFFKHLTVVLSLMDEAYSLKHKILNCSEKNLSEEEYSKLMYSYLLEDAHEKFKNKLSHYESAFILAAKDKWISAVSESYLYLRNSMKL